jgi:large conductance mechanosensitive channel
MLLAQPKRLKMFKEFLAFLKEYGVIGLAIAVIIGGKLNDFIGSLVNDLLMPLIFQPALQAAGVDEIGKLNFMGIFYGKVLGAGINFIIVAAAVFVFAKMVLKEEVVAKK